MNPRRKTAFTACLLLICLLSAACNPTPRQDTSTAELLPAFSLAAHLNTSWKKEIIIREDPYSFDQSLVIYENGEAILTHDRVDYRLKDSGETYLLEKDLYATPQDPNPALTLQAGEIRLYEDGSAVRIAVLSDPLGIFAGFSTEHLTLKLWQYPPYRYRMSRDYGFAPHFQPGTTWWEKGPHLTENGGLSYYANTVLDVDADGSVHAKIRMTPESQQEDGILLWAEDAAALIRPDGELLFYGGVREGAYDEQERCLTYRLQANYDPYDLSFGNTQILKKSIHTAEPRDVLGRNRYQIIAEFTDAGWTCEPLSLFWNESDGEVEEDPDHDYGTLFLKLTKDASMLLIYLDGYREAYALSYVLIDANGSLESWGVMRPGDHTLADSYRVSDPFPFEDAGLWGLWEDDSVLPLDDGRIFVSYRGHESGEVLSFIIFDPRGK